MLENLAQKGVKQQGSPDIETLKVKHPEVLFSFALLMKKMGLSCSWLLADGAVPDCIVSGYRDFNADPEVKNSPHKFAIALDVMVSRLDARVAANRPIILDEQIKWITTAVESGLFTRGGFYPQQNTIHLDQADQAWMETYHGTPFWVKWNGKYEGFTTLNGAVDYCRQLVSLKS